jgi:predicted Fe-S protein YdhL (DUF1289 family)
MDEASGWCVGCGRTIDEIAAWSALDDAAKRVVWEMLPARMARLGSLAQPAVARAAQDRGR